MNDHTPNTVGVDISKAHLDAHRLRSAEAARFANDPAGIEALAAWIGASASRVVYESTGPWHRALEETLAGRLPLSRVNAMRARRFAQAMGHQVKTDAVDARALARMGAAFELRRIEVRSPVRRDLDELHTARDALVKDRTAALNRQKHVRHPLLKRQLKNRLEQNRRQIKILDEEIAKPIDDDKELSRQSEVLASIPGIAQVTAAGLLSEMPELGRIDGNTADPATVGVQIDKLRKRFGLDRVVLVGDRGMLTEARIRQEVEPAGLDWISALRGPAVRSLVESGAVQLSLFDRKDLVEIRSTDYPGERLMVCRNPLLAAERARKREDLLQATEAVLDPIVAATRRDKYRLKGQDRIGLRVGKVIGKYKMAKHFDCTIAKASFSYRRKAESIAAEAALDGLYIVRTSLPETELNAEQTVLAYKSLSAVERAFRSFKTVDLKVRPIYHYTATRVRAHVFLCMLAYYVEWHMRQQLKPLLFDDEEPAVAQAQRTSVVAPAQVSPSAKNKARRKRTADGRPVHSFRSLLGHLATITKNRVVAQVPGAEPFEVITRPTAHQNEAFKLLGVRLKRTQ